MRRRMAGGDNGAAMGGGTVRRGDDASSGTEPTEAAGDALADTVAGSGEDATISADASMRFGLSPAWRDAGGTDAPAPNVRYRLRGEVGRGGIGRVLSAEDAWLGRTIAIKELRAEREEAAARFRREASITARLQHPGIVPIHDAGHWLSGAPFYAMPLVSGQTLAQAIDAAGDLRGRLALVPRVLAVAEAVAYAHSQRVIHRDLKPANVLLGAFGETIVIDWGLAKDLSDDAADPETSGAFGAADVGDTRLGAVMGTPSFMAPEQGTGRDVDERADVYALGAILYTVLAGAAPYSGSDSKTVVQLVAAGPPRPVRELAPSVSGELVAIVDKAMARDPSERYATAGELAADLKRFETGQLVSAHAYSLRQLVRRWVARHRTTVVIGAVAFAAIATTGALSLRRVVRARAVAVAERARADEQRDRAERESERARRWSAGLTLLQARNSLDRDPTQALAWLKHLEIDEDNVTSVREIAHSALAAGAARVVLEREDPVSVFNVAFSPDGAALATPWADGTAILVRDLSSGEQRVLTSADGTIENLAFADGGRALVAATTTGAVQRWSLDDGTVALLGRHRDRAGQLVVDATAGWIASAGLEDRVLVWDRGKTAPRVLSAGSPIVWGIAGSPDGRLLATAGSDGAVRVWDVAAGTSRELGRHRGAAYTVAFVPDGGAVVSVGDDGAVLWWAVDGSARRELGRHDKAASDVELSPDGRFAATSSDDRTIGLWPVHGGAPRRLRGHEMETFDVAFAPDGATVASSSIDGTVRVWDVAHGGARVLRGHRGAVYAAVYGPDGALASSDALGEVRLWHRTPPPSRLLAEAARFRQVIASPDGRHVAAASASGAVIVVDTATWEAREVARHTGGAWGVDVSPDGAVVASSGDDGAIRLSAVDGTSSRVVVQRSRPVHAVAVGAADGWLFARDADGATFAVSASTGDVRELPQRGAPWAVARVGATRVAVGEAAGRVTIVDVAGGDDVPLVGLTQDVALVIASADEGTVVARGGEGELAAWNARTGARTYGPASCHPLSPLAFSPRGRKLAYADAEHRIAVVELGAGRVSMLRGHRDAVRDLAFDPAGERLVSTSRDGTVRTWNAATADAVVLASGASQVRSAVFTPDGMAVVTAADDGALRLWPPGGPDPVPTDSAGLQTWLRDSTSAVVEPPP